jgi:hypothetical protein
VKSLVAGLPLDLRFRTKGQLAIDILDGAYAGGLAFGFVCGDEVYGSCTELRKFLEDRGQAYVLRVASSFTVALAAGTTMTRADAVNKLTEGSKGREVRSAGQGSKGERWYAWAWIGTVSPRHSLLVRRHLKTGELAFHYCYVPDGQAAAKARLIKAAGLRWPVRPGPVPGPALHRDPAAHRAGNGRSRGLRGHRRQLRKRTGAQAPPPAGPDDKPPADPGLIPLTVHEIKRLLAAALCRPQPPSHTARWLCQGPLRSALGRS